MNTIVVTGASRGIGRATAVRLAASGRRLILNGRDEEALRKTAELVQSAGGRPELIVGDLTTKSGIEALAAGVSGESLDVLVNNAGLSNVAAVEKLTLEAWEQTMAVNLTAPFMLTQKLMGKMGEGAAIVNLLSVACKVSFPEWSAYTASKAALEGFSRILREEMRPRGIRVIDIYPAATATDLWDEVPGEWNREGMLDPREVAESIAYALDRPSGVLVDSISVGNLGGNL